MQMLLTPLLTLAGGGRPLGFPCMQALDEPAPRSDGIRVGVVYCEADQTNENEFFSNRTRSLNHMSATQ